MFGKQWKRKTKSVYYPNRNATNFTNLQVVTIFQSYTIVFPVTRGQIVSPDSIADYRIDKRCDGRSMYRAMSAEEVIRYEKCSLTGK